MRAAEAKEGEKEEIQVVETILQDDLKRCVASD